MVPEFLHTGRSNLNLTQLRRISKGECQQYLYTFSSRASKLLILGNSKEIKGCFTSDSLLVASVGFN